jgi:excisionase family DNA binding protein
VALGRAFLPLVSTSTASPPSATNISETERLAYSIQESADLLGVDYFSVYRLIQRGKLRACRALRGKLLVPRTELLRLLKGSNARALGTGLGVQLTGKRDHRGRTENR